MELTFWSPNRICLRAFLETFIRQRNSRVSSPGGFWGLEFLRSSAWTVPWSALSIMSYTESPWISRSSWNTQRPLNNTLGPQALRQKSFQNTMSSIPSFLTLSKAKEWVLENFLSVKAILSRYIKPSTFQIIYMNAPLTCKKNVFIGLSSAGD